LEKLPALCIKRTNNLAELPARVNHNAGMQNTIHGLIKKRGEIAGQHKVAIKAADAIKADLDAIDRALVLCGYEDDPKGIAPRGKYKQLFGRNELKLTVRDMLDIGGWDKSHLMVQFTYLAGSEMSAAAGFHRNDASRKLTEKLQNLCPPQPLAQNRLTYAVGPMHLEHIFSQIESDRDNIRHNRSPLWIIANPLWHINAVGGAVTSSKPCVT